MNDHIESFGFAVGTLLGITSGASIAFGVDRTVNHDLHIGGGFFLFLGVLGVVAAFGFMYLLARHGRGEGQ
jgi:hypothetical protein